MMIRDDHLHTKYSDGHNTPEEMIKTAIKLGYSGITFTDHVRKDSDWVYTYIEELSDLKKKYDAEIDIGIGVECKVLDYYGNIDCPEEILDMADVEKVAAIHRIPCGSGRFIRRDEIANRKFEAFENYINAIEGLASNHFVRRLAHPFSLAYDLDINSSEKWNRVLSALQKAGKYIEYNLKYDNDFVPDSVWNMFAGRIVLGSDSHSVDEMFERNIKLRDWNAK